MSTILIVVWMIVLFIAYHKIFTVYYFSLGHGLLREVMVICALACVMTYITLALWWVMAIIVFSFGYNMYKKTGSKKMLIATLVCVFLFSSWALSAKESYIGSAVNESLYLQTV